MRCINGHNGGTFYLSTETWKEWSLSLGFYRGVSFSARIKKTILFLAYPLQKSNCTREDVSRRIFETTGVEAPLDGAFSAIISPTRDKAVVHLHGKGYWKSATGSSYPGVSKEAVVYALLSEKQPSSFSFSKIVAHKDDGERVSFMMLEDDSAFTTDKNMPITHLLKPLSEFYRLRSNGLVHGDFKPWNVRWRRDGRPHFFDFEENHTGEPLEDLLNYIIQPLLLRHPPEEVKELTAKPCREALCYMSMLEIPNDEYKKNWLKYWEQLAKI